MLLTPIFPFQLRSNPAASSHNYPLSHGSPSDLTKGQHLFWPSQPNKAASSHFNSGNTYDFEKLSDCAAHRADSSKVH